MSCSCSRILENSLRAVWYRNIGERNRLVEELERFKGDVRSGAYQLAARHLYRAGVYFASLDNGLSQSPEMHEIILSLRRRVAGRGGLGIFFERNLQLIREQAEYVNPQDLLRRMVRLGSKALGLLEGDGLRELVLAERVLERLERLERYFDSWREWVAGEFRAELLKIVDMHD